MRLLVDVGPDPNSTVYRDYDTREALDVQVFEAVKTTGFGEPGSWCPRHGYHPVKIRTAFRCSVTLRDGTFLEPTDVIFEVGRAAGDLASLVLRLGLDRSFQFGLGAVDPPPSVLDDPTLGDDGGIDGT